MREIEEVIEELKRQDEKWGEQNHSDLMWLGILVEEVGEIARAILDGEHEWIETEIVQTAAVACQWVASRRRQKGSQN